MTIISMHSTSEVISKITLLKKEEIFHCKRKIKKLEVLLEKEHSSINLYKYKQANERLHNLKSIIIDLQLLQLKAKHKF